MTETDGARLRFTDAGGDAGETRIEDPSISLVDRVFLTRVQMFFGHAVGNMIAALFGAFLIALVLSSAEVPSKNLLIWFAIIVLLTGNVALLEHRFQKTNLTISNAHTWANLRMICGAMVGLAYGVAPFLFIADVTVASEMFIFIILSAMVTVAGTGYSSMPLYFLVLNGVTMVPLTIYLLMKPDFTHQIMALTALIWQAVVLSKAWGVSRSTIAAIELNERLQEEVKLHKDTKEQLRHMAYHDFLTGVANRLNFIDYAGKSIARAQRQEQKVAFLAIDLNGFKAVNDTYGHDAGDEVLKVVTSRILESIRQSDMLARVGGDEFFVLLENIETVELVEKMSAGLASKVSKEIERTTENGTQRFAVGASIGYAIFPDDGTDLDEILKTADERMYQHKAEQFAP